MRRLMLIHGVNLNLLGKRDVIHYGHLTLKTIEKLTKYEAKKHGYHLICYQSNHEGRLIDKLQSKTYHCAGIIINPGAFTHYSYALHDAILDTRLPCVEVHLSQLSEREAFRQHSVIAPACIKSICGKKEQGYLEAVQALTENLRSCK